MPGREDLDTIVAPMGGVGGLLTRAPPLVPPPAIPEHEELRDGNDNMVDSLEEAKEDKIHHKDDCVRHQNDMIAVGGHAAEPVAETLTHEAEDADELPIGLGDYEREYRDFQEFLLEMQREQDEACWRC